MVLSEWFTQVVLSMKVLFLKDQRMVGVDLLLKIQYKLVFGRMDTSKQNRKQ